ncbi:MAG: hypothetical protein M1499_00705 [Firmicutes bacterium]|nr:hypothetical protein [Bacillota bacterium]
MDTSLIGCLQACAERRMLTAACRGDLVGWWRAWRYYQWVTALASAVSESAR